MASQIRCDVAWSRTVTLSDETAIAVQITGSVGLSQPSTASGSRTTSPAVFLMRKGPSLRLVRADAIVQSTAGGDGEADAFAHGHDLAGGDVAQHVHRPARPAHLDAVRARAAGPRPKCRRRSSCE